MKRPRLTGAAGCLLAVGAIILAGTALAYFSANGTGNAAAAVTQSRPASTALSRSANTTTK